MNWIAVFPFFALACCLLVTVTDPSPRWCLRILTGYLVGMAGYLITTIARHLTFPGEPMTETFETALNALASLSENPTARLVTTAVGLAWASVCVARGAWWAGRKAVRGAAGLFESKPLPPPGPFAKAILDRLDSPGWVYADGTFTHSGPGLQPMEFCGTGVLKVGGTDVLYKPNFEHERYFDVATEKMGQMLSDAKRADLLAKVLPKPVPEPAVKAETPTAAATKPAGVPVGTATIPNVTKEQMEKIIEEIKKNAWGYGQMANYVPYWPGVPTPKV